MQLSYAIRKVFLILLHFFLFYYLEEFVIWKINGCASGSCISMDLALVFACQAQSTQSHCNRTVLWAVVIYQRASYSKIKAITQKKPTIQPVSSTTRLFYCRTFRTLWEKEYRSLRQKEKKKSSTSQPSFHKFTPIQFALTFVSM